MKPYSSKLVNFFLLIASIIISIIFCELIIRVFYPQTLISDLMEPCSEYGLCMKKNTVGIQKSKEFNVTIHLNSMGFRGEDIKINIVPTKKRILIVGDSFVFGYGVNENETFSWRLRNLIEQIKPGKYEIINFGQLNFGTAHELKKIQEIGLLLKPYLVILNVYMGNDLYENKRLFDIIDNELIEIKPKISKYETSRKVSRWIPFSPWLRENSHLFRLFGRFFLNILAVFPSKKEEIIEYKEIELYRLILLRLKKLLDQHNILLAVTLIPYHAELDEYLEGEKTYPSFKDELKFYRESIKKITEEMKIPILDFYEYFSKEKTPKRRYFKNDPHWNEYGHEFASRALFNFLIANKLIE